MAFLPVYVRLLLCSHSLSRNLTGMAIADITLLSGFEAQTVDLDNVSNHHSHHHHCQHGSTGPRPFSHFKYTSWNLLVEYCKHEGNKH